MDLTEAFFRISVPKQYRRLTAYRIGDNQYQFRKMPFGLKTAPATFQRYMDHGLSDLSHEGYWYLDDILVWGESRSQLQQRTKHFRQRIRRMGSQVNEQKSEYEQQTILFAGLTLHAYGIGPNPVKGATFQSLPFPRTKKDMQSALGLVSYLRDFIPLIAHFTWQLYPSTTSPPPGNPLKAWELLQAHVQSALTSMRHFKEGTPAQLYADASGGAIGNILIQDKRIVAVAARKLSPAETRYSATDREHIALVYAARKFRLILDQPENATEVYSDHAALITRRSTDLSPRQERWKQIVTERIRNLTHVKGAVNPADLISRWPGLEGGGQVFA
jgi:hypothetical protein